MELLEDVVTLALVVSIQLGVPVTVLFVIGYLRYRGNPARRELRLGRLAVAGAGIAGGVHDLPAPAKGRPCWEVKHCSSEVSRACPARQQREMLCWQATRTPKGHVRVKCVNCDRFLAPPARRSTS